MSKLKIAAIFLALALLPTACVVVSMVNKPAALVSRATDTSHMINNYEWFHDAANNYNARVAQIASYKVNLVETTDKAERSRIRVDIAGVQQSCRELVAKYEAQSNKINTGYLKGASLPESLNAKECE